MCTRIDYALLVAGGRNVWPRLDDMLTEVLLIEKATGRSIQAIIQGGASGVDQVAREYAAEASLPCFTFHANWSTHGRAAGPIRNAEMARVLRAIGGAALIYPGGRGTASISRELDLRNLAVFTPQVVS